MHIRPTPSLVRIALVLMLLAAVALAGCGDTTDGLDVGDQAPDFTLPTASGAMVSLDDYTGPALLYFHMADG